MRLGFSGRDVQWGERLSRDGSRRQYYDINEVVDTSESGELA